MNRKFLEGNCAECGGPLRYPAEQVGTMGRCPHCGKQTELLLAVPNVESTLPRRAIIVVLIAVIILGGGLIGTIVALNKARTWAADRQGKAKTQPVTIAAQPGPAVSPPEQMEGLGISPVSFEATRGAAVRHATGFATNLLDRPRGNLRLEIDLLNAAGTKVGIAIDSTIGLKPGEIWNFRAPVLLTNAIRARIASVTEQ